MSDEAPLKTCKMLRVLKDRRFELTHQRDTLEFQMRTIDARIEELQDMIEYLEPPEQPAEKRGRGRPPKTKPVVVSSQPALIPSDAGHDIFPEDAA